MTDAAPSEPLVSVGVPLYASNRFLKIIVENIQSIAYPNIEVIFSDRHLLDDALERLKQRFGSDGRCRFLEGTDELSWVEHFNLLLRESKGKYAVVMPHDDSYPPHYVGDLAAALERRPEAVLAFGRVEQLSLDGFLPTLPFSPPPVDPTRPWSLSDALRLLTMWQLWLAFRGMVRCSIVRRSNLYLRPTYRNIRADIYWVFGLLLRGPLEFVPSCWCTKRFHQSSTGAVWRFDLRQSLDACRVLSSYLRDLAPSRLDALAGRIVVCPWCVVQALLPRGTARRLLDFYETRVVRRRRADGG